MLLGRWFYILCVILGAPCHLISTVSTPIISMPALELALGLILQTRTGRLHLMSVQQTEYLICLAER